MPPQEERTRDDALLHDFSTSRLLDLPLQIAPPSNTWFTRSPEWGWFIVVYFFLGGIAGGAAFLSGLLDLLGNRLDRRMTRIGYLDRPGRHRHRRHRC